MLPTKPPGKSRKRRFYRHISAFKGEPAEKETMERHILFTMHMHIHIAFMTVSPFSEIPF